MRKIILDLPGSLFQRRIRETSPLLSVCQSGRFIGFILYHFPLNPSVNLVIKKKKQKKKDSNVLFVSTHFYFFSRFVLYLCATGVPRIGMHIYTGAPVLYRQPTNISSLRESEYIYLYPAYHLVSSESRSQSVI